MIDDLYEIKAQHLIEPITLVSQGAQNWPRLWEESCHSQLIDNPGMLRQKLDYIHLNPVKRSYVDLALFQCKELCGQQGFIADISGWSYSYRSTESLRSPQRVVTRNTENFNVSIKDT